MKYELRANQLVGTGGVGAIVDIGDESFVVCDTLTWGQPSTKVSLPRLESRLHRQLRRPPAAQAGSRGHVLLRRFPESLFCNRPKCRRIIIRWNEEKYGNPEGRPKCPYCSAEGSLVPMRFVAACREGHLSDVPWNLWVPHSKPTCRKSPQLRLDVDSSGTGGLESLVIHCLGCSGKRSLASITAKDAMRDVGAKCLGRHPWIYDDTASCSEPLEVLQRGATNLYYPMTASALSIGGETPDIGSELEELQSSADFQLLVKSAAKHMTGGNFVPPFIEEMINDVAAEHNLRPEQVLHALQERDAGSGDEIAEDFTEWSESEVLAEEWAFLSSPAAESYKANDLVCRASDPPRFGGRSPFSRVLLLSRLREVRALLGFRRVEPGAALVMAEAGKSFPNGTRPWVPAVEVFGEGIFIAFDEKWVSKWETALLEHPEERERLLTLETVRQSESYWFLPAVSPRFIALHTFAHALMRQLVFESGYSSSALRERIYAARGAAGVLIYTADGDSEGSLGGLVRQGQRDRLGDTILLALDKAIWCSADPVCSETNGQGLGGFNRAACHACALVPETSCPSANTLLDRGLLLGRHGVPGLLDGLV